MSSLIYRVISEWNVGGDLDDSIILKPGTVLYTLRQPDYGSAWLHTRLDGERYVSVTADEAGGYPFYTVPARVLRPVRVS